SEPRVAGATEARAAERESGRVLEQVIATQMGFDVAGEPLGLEPDRGPHERAQLSILLDPSSLVPEQPAAPGQQPERGGRGLPTRSPASQRMARDPVQNQLAPELV